MQIHPFVSINITLSAFIAKEFGHKREARSARIEMFKVNNFCASFNIVFRTIKINYRVGRKYFQFLSFEIKLNYFVSFASLLHDSTFMELLVFIGRKPKNFVKIEQCVEVYSKCDISSPPRSYDFWRVTKNVRGQSSSW